MLTQARRFEELAVDHEGKEMPVLEPVESGVRPWPSWPGLPDGRDPPVLTAQGRLTYLQAMAIRDILHRSGPNV